MVFVDVSLESCHATRILLCNLIGRNWRITTKHLCAFNLKRLGGKRRAFLWYLSIFLSIYQMVCINTNKKFQDTHKEKEVFQHKVSFTFNYVILKDREMTANLFQ